MQRHSNINMPFCSNATQTYVVGHIFILTAICQFNARPRHNLT